MTAITKEEYEFFKSQNPEDLTQEELNWINEYEKAEAGAPSDEDLEWARYIVNEKDPQYQKINRESGDLDRAMSIINQKRVADELMVSRDQDPYVKKVKSTPEDVVKKGGFKFNWRDAYEQVKGEKLRATEADAKKLQDFIGSSMYNVDDDIRLKQIAYNLHMYNPNTMKWSEFINSEQGDEFKKYLEDVRKAQTEKAVEDIWEGKEPVKVNYPLIGPTDVPLSRQAVDFMLPVSKEYASNHYNDEDFSLTGPLLTDAVANLVMAGPGAAEALPAKFSVPVAKEMRRPVVSWLYGNVAAPVITETGNAIFNEESIPEALARTAEGTLINIATPRIIEGGLTNIGRGLPGEDRTVQKMVDEAANKARDVQRKAAKGVPYSFYLNKIDDTVPDKVPYEFYQDLPDGKIRYYSSDIDKSKRRWKSREYLPLKDMPNEAISQEEMNAWRQGTPFVRNKWARESGIGLSRMQDIGYLMPELVLKKAQSLAKDGDLRNLTPAELRQLGFADKESFINFIVQTVKENMPETVQSYLTNAAGRPEFGREGGPIEVINRIFGTNLFGSKSKDDKEKSRIERILGVE